jgi:3-methyl-2-oxobutanoate hydroxymethyltransferase
LEKKTAYALRGMKDEKIVMLTAYDFSNAQIVEAAGVDMILVGDSAGVVVHGFKSTREVTMEMMVHHVAAVRRGASNTHLVADMPYRSCDTPKEAVANAFRFIREGADSVKVEGAIPDVVRALRAEGIEVMGHVGLTPQTATSHKARGRTEEEAVEIKQGADILEKAGCFAVVLEHMPLGLAKDITDHVGIPTIGIGAGVHCDGQVLVLHDMLGMFDRFKPPFVKRYAQLGPDAKAAVAEYAREVREGLFPDTGHSTE